MKSLFEDDDSLAPLPQRILLHFKRYKASFLAAITRVVLSGDQRRQEACIKEVEEAINYLIDRGFIKRLGGDSFFGREVLFLAGHPVKAADVSLTYHCIMEEPRKFLLTYSELKPLFSAEDLPIPFHNFRHTICPGIDGEPPSISRVYSCRAQRKSTREQIRRHLKDNSRDFSDWLDQGSYQLSVLVGSEARKEEINRVVSETYRNSEPLNHIAGITCYVVPTEETFEMMLKGAR